MNGWECNNCGKSFFSPIALIRHLEEELIEIKDMISESKNDLEYIEEQLKELKKPKRHIK